MERNELNKQAMGGTELMGMRMERDINPSLLSQFQIIHSRFRKFHRNRRPIMVLHDLPTDPEVQHLKDGGWKKFDLLVFVSYWQQEMYNLYLGVPYSAGIVLKNAIEPIEPHKKPEIGVGPDDKIRLIYHSTPHRGLDILYATYNQLCKEYDDIELNVFSSFELYGWGQRDEPFKDLFDKLRNHPRINYHKSVPNERIREELKKSHIFAYPSKWQETSCLCLIEAMSAGCLPVHSSLAALPETSLGLTNMYGYIEDPQQHANRFYIELKQAIELFRNKNKRKYTEQRLSNMKALADYQYDWGNRSLQWENVLKSLLTDKE